MSIPKDKVLLGILVLALAVCLAACGPKERVVDDDDTTSLGQTDDMVTVDWTLAIDCSICHEANQASLSDPSKGVGIHEQMATITCVSCHDDERALGAVHKNVTASSAVTTFPMKTVVRQQACQQSGCHDVSSEEYINQGANYTQLVDINGTRVNPHEVMGLSEGHSKTTCSSCHAMHAAEIKAYETCVPCHHQGVYECNTCH